MSVQRILIPLAALAVLFLSHRYYGWMGVAAAAGLLVMWLLLHFHRLMQVLQRAAKRPVGYVDSAVMLNAKLRPGRPLMHVIALTRSLGERLSAADAQPEIYRWRDGSGSSVSCEFEGGKLQRWRLERPAQLD